MKACPMQKEPKFKRGDIVKVRAGGPDMTVEDLLSGSGYRCYWFVGKKLERGHFNEEGLVKGEAGDEGETA